MKAQPHIPRPAHQDRLLDLLDRHPAVAILGARQVGKTTLARQVEAAFEGQTTRFDLEDPDDLSRLDEPGLALRPLEGLVIIDEIQRRPDLFTVLRVLIDRPERQARFLLLGSASPNLLRQSSESLAGRIVYHELAGFDLREVGVAASADLWLRGGFPRAFLAPSEAASTEWSSAYVRAVVERDLPQLGLRIPSVTMHRFWRMLAHYHAQLWNGAELGRAFGVAHTTVRRYLDALTGALLVRQLMPWHENLGKRQVRSPKVYLADTGVLHTLLGIQSHDDLYNHPKVGASWEGYVLAAIVRHLGVPHEECFFWAAHGGAEIDLVVMHRGRRLGFEIKRTTAPKATRSLHAAKAALRLERVDLIHAGAHTFELREGVRAVAFSKMFEDVEVLVRESARRA